MLGSLNGLVLADQDDAPLVEIDLNGSPGASRLKILDGAGQLGWQRLRR